MHFILCFIFAFVEVRAFGEGRISSKSDRTVQAKTEYGWVIGKRLSFVTFENKTVEYASFKGVPYATQPVGELRFVELKPPTPWNDYFQAFEEGPICPQHDILYGNLMDPKSITEACIHLNIHVPMKTPSKRLVPPYKDVSGKRGLPILVFIHGGGFAFGSGDSDVYGPEKFMDKDVIVITFNYRLGLLGFLNLNTKKVSGNAGLRDMVTLLKWVRNNANYFGGDPDDVTVAGQSAGAVAAHLLTLSEGAKGLFHKVIIMSGTGVRSFTTPSQVYHKTILGVLNTFLGINTTDTEELHQTLIKTPIANIIQASNFVLSLTGATLLFPTVEQPFDGVLTMIGKDPESMQKEAWGNHIPMIVGFTENECDSFKQRFREVDLINKVTANPLIVVPISLAYKASSEDVNVAESVLLAKRVMERYSKPSFNIDNLVEYCTDSSFVYPAFHVARTRAEFGAERTYMYQFSYRGLYRDMEIALNTKLDGAAHIEDVTYAFRTRLARPAFEVAPFLYNDYCMDEWMTTWITNFVRHSYPAKAGCDWSPVTSNYLQYQDIRAPECLMRPLTLSQKDTLTFYDNLYKA